MQQLKPKGIKPGKRAYSIPEIAENIKRFLTVYSSGKIVMRVHNRQVVHIAMLGAVDVMPNSESAIVPAKVGDLKPGQRVYSIEEVAERTKRFLTAYSFGTIEMRVLCREVIEHDMWGAMDVIRNLQPNVKHSS